MSGNACGRQKLCNNTDSLTCLLDMCSLLWCAYRYTFVENVQNPHSVTILIKGPSDHVIAQIKVGTTIECMY